MLYIFITLWIICGICAYIRFFLNDKPRFGWALRDRLSCSICSLLLGPICLIVSLWFYFGIKNKINLDRQVNW